MAHAPSKPGSMAGISEIAQLLQVTKQRADQLANTGGFPAPKDVLASGPVWERAAILRWAADAGRTITP